MKRTKQDSPVKRRACVEIQQVILQKLSKGMPANHSEIKKLESEYNRQSRRELRNWILETLHDLGGPSKRTTLGWRVNRLSEVIDCAQSVEPLSFATAIAEFIAPEQPEALRKIALSYFASLRRPLLPPIVVEATVEWIDAENAICRFEHPQIQKFGMVERQFPLLELPTGIQQGERFHLEIDTDTSGRPVAYTPRKDERLPANSVVDALERPLYPGHRATAEARRSYRRLLDAYHEALFKRDAGKY